MNRRLFQIESELKNIAVTKDMYELWLHNDVTRVFRLTIEKLLIEAQIKDSFGSSIEQIAISEIKRSTTASVLENVLDWNPITDSE